MVVGASRKDQYNHFSDALGVYKISYKNVLHVSL